MKTQQIEEILDKYFKGESSLEEEKILKDFFRGNDVPDHLLIYREQFGYLLEKQNLKSEKLSDQWFDKLESSPRQSKAIHISWGLGIAASLSLLLIGFLSGLLISAGKPVENKIEIADLQKDMQEMKNLLMINQLQLNSASDRIKAVNQVYGLTEVDQEIVIHLINTLNSDNNTNVRLAAAQTLFKFKKDKFIRQSLVSSLKMQKDPALQITLIDMLVEMEEKEALTEIQKLIQDDQTLDVVKKKARNGISKLL